MKKLLYCAAALSAVLFAGSCQRENLEPVVKGGVTYTISLPETVQTKGSNGYAEGYDLYYEVYKTADLTELEKAEVLFDNFDAPIEMTSNKTEVPFDLLNDQDYTILFWANKKDAECFELDDLRKVGIKSSASNNNDRDAFCTMDQLRNVNGALTKTVTLTRPFAQLNIATEIPAVDYDVIPDYSYVKVTKVPTVYNVATGAATGDAVVEFSTAAVPVDKKVTVGTKDYNLVAMNYVLVPESNIEVYYAIETANGVVTNTINNVPVKKNYRTNIVGNLLTSNATYTVELMPGFETEDEVLRVVGNSVELAAAIAEAESGETIYIEGEMEIPFFTNKSLYFVGVNKATSVIIDPSCKQDTKRFENSQLYFENLTMRGSGYGGTYKSSHGYVGAVAETYNDCVFENYFMFWSDVTTINDCVFNGIEGQYFWTGNSDELTFNNCQFNGVDRALNVCGATAGEERVVTFNNCNFSASKQNKAAIEIDGKGVKYTININNSTATGFKASESTGEEFFNIKNAPENVTVYVNGAKWLGKDNWNKSNITVYTAEDLQNEINAATGDITVTFGADLTGNISFNQKSGNHITILGEGKKYTGGIHIFGNGGANDRWTTIKDINFDGTGLNDNQGCIYTTGAANGLNSYACNVTIENCTFTGAGVAAIRQNVAGERNWTIRNCTVDNTMHSFLQVSNTNESLIVENCKVYSKNGANLNSTCTATFTGCEFDVRGYAVRVGVNSGGNPDATKEFNFNECTLKSENNDGDAVVIIRKDAERATLNFVNTDLIGNPQISGNVEGKTTINGI